MPDIVQYLLLRAASKGRIAAQHNIEYNATRPHIALLVILLRQHLRGDVVCRSYLLRQEFALLYSLARAEINDFEIRIGFVVGVQHILRFEVAMHYALFVHVHDC
jgi:hypothetical protein